MGLFSNLGRIGTGVLTGGLSEIGRAVGGSGAKKALDFVDSAYLPVGGALAGGAMLGPLGANVGGMFGNAMGGAGGSGLGGAAGTGIFGSDMGRFALGGSLLGLGMAQDTGIPDINVQGLGQSRGMIDQEQGRQGNMLSQALARQRGINQEGMQGQQGLNQGYMSQLQGMNDEQNNLMGQRMQSQRDQLLNQLTNGPEGEAFRQKYNNMGLLNSGAFNTGLANQFGNLASQQQQDILSNQIAQQQALQGAAGQGFQGMSNLQNQGGQNLSGLSEQGYQTQSGLSSGGLGREFGLQDVQTQVNMARAIQEAQNKAQLQQSLIGTGGQILGGMDGGQSGGSGNPLGGLLNGAGNILGGVYNKFLGGNSGQMQTQPFPQGAPYNQPAPSLGMFGSPGSGVMRYWGS